FGAWISPWLVATYDPIEGTFGSVCRVMSGFSDAFYKENTIKFVGRLLDEEGEEGGGDVADGGAAGDAGGEGGMEGVEESGDSGSEGGDEVEGYDEGVGAAGGLQISSAADGLDTGESPTYWFQPSEVWEIRGADISISPVHGAGRGIVHATRGLSLRFPRFIRKRPDKRVCDATTPQQLAQLYSKQASVATCSSGAVSRPIAH
ncbi:MAG: hypothetical protein SGPRY_011028, partial [Prymnesium sp.]